MKLEYFSRAREIEKIPLPVKMKLLLEIPNNIRIDIR
jgi:hypothetical protein